MAEKISNKELAELAGLPVVKAEGVSDDPIKEGFQTFAKPIIGGISAIGSILDRFVQAPTRAGVSEFVQSSKEAIDKPPETFRETFTKDPVLKSIIAGAKQFGRDPSQAPKFKETATDLGITDKPISEFIPGQTGGILSKVSPAGAAGLGADVVVDPTNFIPLGTIAKIAGKLGLKTVGAGAKVGAKAADVLTGTQVPTDVIRATQEAGETFTSGVKSSLGAKQVPEFQESVEIARRAGIGPEDLPKSVEFGKGSLISRTERALAEGPSGEKILKKFETGKTKIEEAVQAQIRGFAQPMDEINAGAFIGQKFDEGINRFFDGMNVSHNKIISAVPNLKLNKQASENLFKNKIKQIELEAEDMINEGITDTVIEQGRQIKRAITNLSNGKGDYASTVKSLRQIGDVAFKSKNSFADIPPNIQKFREMYFAIDEALIKTVTEDLSPEAAKQLKRFNKVATDLFSEKSAVANILGNTKIGTEKHFKALTSDTRKIEALQKVLSPEDMATVKASYLQSLIKPDAEGTFSAKLLGNRMRSPQVRNVLKKMFQPNELNEINDFIKLTDRFGDAVLSMSGTGASNAFLDFFKNTLARTTETFIISPIQRRAKQPVSPISQLFPAIQTPKEFIKSPGARLKGAQVLSVQQQPDREQAIQRQLNGGN